VVTGVWAGIESRAFFLRRLAVVFADELRLKIVTELYMREMSPSQFYEEFGGGSVSRVDRHFKRLAEHGWLRFIRKESGGGRRGGTEHFYRARELAAFDNETWALLPYSIRVAFSWTIFKQFAERVCEALQAETFDARPDRHFTWTPILLDQIGWERIVARIDALFESLFEEQEDAKLRIYNSGEKPILVTAALGGFESPTRPQGAGDARATANLAEAIDCPFPFTLRVSKVFADPLCLKIVTELNLRTMSAPQFYKEHGSASVDGIRRRFKMLAEIGWLRKVDQKSGGKRRGAIENFYRATGPAVFDNGAWSDLPDSIKATYSWTIFEQLSDQVKEAMQASTFDARPDRHLSWSLLRLDQLGWENVVSAVDALFAFIFEEEKSAELRMDASGEKPLTMTVAMAAFESPKDSVKAH
jgi:DNA-binding transcriptional ArsR family regulator